MLVLVVVLVSISAPTLHCRKKRRVHLVYRVWNYEVSKYFFIKLIDYHTIMT
jgi:hypothetical protein